jgi:hypothetical protein
VDRSVQSAYLPGLSVRRSNYQFGEFEHTDNNYEHNDERNHEFHFSFVSVFDPHDEIPQPAHIGTTVQFIIKVWPFEILRN